MDRNERKSIDQDAIEKYKTKYKKKKKKVKRYTKVYRINEGYVFYKELKKKKKKKKERMKNIN